LLCIKIRLSRMSGRGLNGPLRNMLRERSGEVILLVTYYIRWKDEGLGADGED